MRTNLIMHFHCSECGKQLDLAYENEAEVKPGSVDNLHQKPPEPTGAKILYTPQISIRPCRNCIEKHTGPAKRLAEALSDFKAMES